MSIKFLAPFSEVTLLALVMTPDVWATVLPALIAAIFVGLVNLYVAKTARLAVLKDIAKVELKIDAISPVVAKIDAHVNSEKTRAQGESDTQKMQITIQREMIEEMKKAAAILAAAKAQTESAGAGAQAASALKG